MMNTKYLLIGILVITVFGSSILTIAAAPNDKAIQARSIHADQIQREKQTIDFSEIEKGSTINNAYSIITLDSYIGDECVLMLNEIDLNKNRISDTFECSNINSVEINQLGKHAMESKIRASQVNISLLSITSNESVLLTPDNFSLTIFYSTPTYYAEIENNTVINVIVAEPEYIETLDGTWIETTKDSSINGKYAGIGFTYDTVNNVFISPQPFNSWTLDNSFNWKPPVEKPIGDYIWNESSLGWVLIE